MRRSLLLQQGVGRATKPTAGPVFDCQMRTKRPILHAKGRTKSILGGFNEWVPAASGLPGASTASAAIQDFFTVGRGVCTESHHAAFPDWPLAPMRPAFGAPRCSALGTQFTRIGQGVSRRMLPGGRLPDRHTCAIKPKRHEILACLRKLKTDIHQLPRSKQESQGRGSTTGCTDGRTDTLEAGGHGMPDSNRPTD
jgi:hypothetical protein